MFEALDQQDVECLLIGGVAIILHGVKCLTRDFDIFVGPALENIAKLRASLQTIFNYPAIAEISLPALPR